VAHQQASILKGINNILNGKPVLSAAAASAFDKLAQQFTPFCWH
jgi:hypothetical protein